MKLYNKCKEFFANEKRIIRDNSEMIAVYNQRIFNVLISCGIISVISLLVVSFSIESFSPMKNGYLILLLLMIMFICILHFYKGKNTVIIYYIFYALVGGYAAHSSAFVTPDYIGIMILLFLFEVPVLILDHTLRLLLFELLMCVVYLIIVIPNKNPALVPDELVNSLLFMAIGSVSGSFFRSARLSSMDLARRLDIERKTDVMTGLKNRLKLYEYFRKIQSDPEHILPYAIAIIDIDNFKQYNDTYGHIAGDKCLGTLGQLFNWFGSDNSIDFYRYGGEEFIAVVLKKPDKELIDFFGDLNKAIEDIHIPHSFMPGGYVTVSIGVIKAGEAHTAEGFEKKIDKADSALYQAKSSGKGRTVEYQEQLV